MSKKQLASEITAVPKRENPYEFPYDYQCNVRTDLMKALQSVSFLLEWSSEVGNEDLDRVAANGLSRILRKAADDAARLYNFDEIHEAGGDPFKVERNKTAAISKSQKTARGVK